MVFVDAAAKKAEEMRAKAFRQLNADLFEDARVAGMIRSSPDYVPNRLTEPEWFVEWFAKRLAGTSVEGDGTYNGIERSEFPFWRNRR